METSMQTAGKVRLPENVLPVKQLLVEIAQGQGVTVEQIYDSFAVNLQTAPAPDDRKFFQEVIATHSVARISPEEQDEIVQALVQRGVTEPFMLQVGLASIAGTAHQAAIQKLAIAIMAKMQAEQAANMANMGKPGPHSVGDAVARARMFNGQ